MLPHFASSADDAPRRRFAEAVDRADARVDLARAALLVAQEEYPQLPVEPYLARLDQLAEMVRDRLADESAPLLVLQELLHTLFARAGFRGNREAYYDPRNSFLNDVLDRKLGIPLTLGVVTLEVGWRLGLPLAGVNFPGHFLVRFEGEELRLLIDPFDGGRTLFEDEAQSLLDRAYGGMVRVRPEFLRTAGRRDMLVRLLTNLKGIYLNVRDSARALTVVERILLIHPTAQSEIRDRGTLLARLGRTEEALEQLEWYLGAAPEANDVERIQALVDELREPGRS
jgi:regulator of sirC expression with transglutaminase-like and TPR domain